MLHIAAGLIIVCGILQVLNWNGGKANPGEI